MSVSSLAPAVNVQVSLGMVVCESTPPPPGPQDPAPDQLTELATPVDVARSMIASPPTTGHDDAEQLSSAGVVASLSVMPPLPTSSRLMLGSVVSSNSSSEPARRPSAGGWVPAGAGGTGPAISDNCDRDVAPAPAGFALVRCSIRLDAAGRRIGVTVVAPGGFSAAPAAVSARAVSPAPASAGAGEPPPGRSNPARPPSPMCATCRAAGP